MSFRILASNASWSALSHILSRGILMLSGILLARYLSTEEFATYNYFQMTATMIATYSAMGLGVAASRYFSELGASNEDKDIIGLLGTLWSTSSISALLIALIVLFIPNHWLVSNLKLSNISVALTVLILALNTVPSGGILGLEKYKSLVTFSIINALIFLLGVYLTIVYKNIIYCIISFILGNAALLLGQTLIILKIIPRDNIKELFIIQPKFFKKIVIFSGPMILVSILSASASWIIGKMILEKFGVQQFAMYSIGLQWFALALFIPGMISRVVLPQLVRKNLNEDSSHRMLKLAGGMALGAATFFCILGSIFSPWIVSWYGEQYSDNWKVIVGFLIAAVLYAPANTLGNAIVAKDGTLSWLVITVIWFITLISISYFLISTEALYGVIYAQIISSLVLLSSTYLFCKKRGII